MRVSAGRRGGGGQGSCGLASDVADFLVARGMPFREAHGVVSRLSEFALEKGKFLHELGITEYKTFSDVFDEDVLSINVESSVEARDVPGGTGFERVAEAIKEARAGLTAASRRGDREA